MVVSNNNSAIENVHEKMERYNMGFITAERSQPVSNHGSGNRFPVEIQNHTLFCTGEQDISLRKNPDALKLYNEIVYSKYKKEIKSNK